jgi:hypothetical protein
LRQGLSPARPFSPISGGWHEVLELGDVALELIETHAALTHLVALLARESARCEGRTFMAPDDSHDEVTAPMSWSHRFWRR